LLEIWSRWRRCVFTKWGVVVLSEIELNLFLRDFTRAQFVYIQIFDFIFKGKGADKRLRGVSDTCDLGCERLYHTPFGKDTPSPAAPDFKQFITASTNAHSAFGFTSSDK
jgi:hypothetical protein